MGNPLGAMCVGREMAGWPVTLKPEANTAICSTWMGVAFASCAAANTSPALGGSIHIVGLTSMSKS